MPSKKRRSSRRNGANETETVDVNGEESPIPNRATADDIHSSPPEEQNPPSTISSDQSAGTTSFLPLTTPTTNETEISIDIESAQKPRNESLVWKFAIKNDDETASCRICGAVIKRKNGSTTGIRKHLLQVHNIQELLSEKTAKTKVKFSSSLRRELHSLIIQAIIKDGRSFDDFRRPGMMKVFHRIVPGKFPLFDLII